MSQEELTSPEAAVSVSTGEEPGKRVRRTKKAEDSAASVMAAPQAPADEAPKRRRGRPRKVAVDAAAAADAAPTTEAEPARARRARAKAPVVADAEAASAAETPADEAPKRRRGRPRKVRPEEAAPAPAVSAQAVSEPARKEIPTPPAAAEPLPASAVAAVSDEDIQPREMRSRRRTRAPRVIESGDAAIAPAKDASEAPSAPANGEGAERVGDSRDQRRSPRKERNREGRDSSFDRSDNRPGRNDRFANDRAGNGRQRSSKNGHQFDRSDNRPGRNDRFANDRHQRRGRNGQNQPMQPTFSREDLAAMKVAELREKAAELEVAYLGLKKAELVEVVFEASKKADGIIEATGILDVMQDGYGFLRVNGYLPGEHDVYVGAALIRRTGLRKGDLVKGQTRPTRPNDKYAALQNVETVNGTPVDALGQRPRFGDLTPIFPNECLRMEHGRSTTTARVIDLVSPIGKGQRGLIVSPPKAGKTTILKDIAAAISANNPEVHLMCLLVDERPEEVTDMQRSIKGEVIASTFDMPTENHIVVSELVIERAKRLVENGEDVVVLLDSLTRLARAYNLAQPASGRILSGGVDSAALYPPKKFLGAARNIEGGGSLTILASALVDTGSKMDEVIFEEFKGTGNMELKLDRSLADRRIFPAIDPVTSGTRKEDLLLNPQEAPLIWAVRRILANMNNTERAMDMLIKSLRQTSNNQEFLIRTAKKAQTSRETENFEF